MTTPRDTTPQSEALEASEKLAGLLKKFDDAITLLSNARDFAKPSKLPRVLDTARRVMLQEGGCAAIEQRGRVLKKPGYSWVPTGKRLSTWFRHSPPMR